MACAWRLHDMCSVCALGRRSGGNIFALGSKHRQKPCPHGDARRCRRLPPAQRPRTFTALENGVAEESGRTRLPRLGTAVLAFLSWGVSADGRAGGRTGGQVGSQRLEPRAVRLAAAPMQPIGHWAVHHDGTIPQGTHRHFISVGWHVIPAVQVAARAGGLSV